MYINFLLLTLRVYYVYNWYAIPILILQTRYILKFILEIWNRTDLTSLSIWDLANELFFMFPQICMYKNEDFICLFVFMCYLMVNLLIQLIFVIDLLLFLWFYFLKTNHFSSCLYTRVFVNFHRQWILLI